MIKHFLCDFLLQHDPWLRDQKGIYGALGGIMHAGLHSLWSLVMVLCLASLISMKLWLIFATIIAEGVLHYHIDWLKSRVAVSLILTTRDNIFWDLFGFDQLLHGITYALMMLVLI